MPAAELNQHITAEDESSEGTPKDNAGVEYEVVNPEGKVVVRTNQHIIDDSASQRLTAEEIQALRQGDTSSGKDIIAKILDSHSALDKKTSFALAKYTLRKRQKYLKRFTVLPLDVPLLTNWMMFEKDPPRIMELREETLALACSYANIFQVDAQPTANGSPLRNDNRWLVVDEVAGLIVAAVAERMGILYPNRSPVADLPLQNGTPNKADMAKQEAEDGLEDLQGLTEEPSSPRPSGMTHPTTIARQSAMAATSNSITLIHQNTQPNISLLQYFGYDINQPDASHPLHTNLRSLSWLQLLHPTEDAAYQEPNKLLSDAELSELKPSRRGAYHRKRRRWERTRTVVDETREGNFAGIIIASFMDPRTILHHAVPLLRGGAQVVVYSPTVEPLTRLVDCYSKLRRQAFLSAEEPQVPSEDFPINPMLLLAPTIYTTRARPWQVLPGRTHPKMTSRGGADGYIFVATRVIPIEGAVKARGTFKKRRAAATEPSSAQTPSSGDVDMEEPAALDAKVDAGAGAEEVG